MVMTVAVTSLLALAFLSAFWGLGVALTGMSTGRLSILNSIGLGLAALMLGVWSLSIAKVGTPIAIAIVVAVSVAIALVRVLVFRRKASQNQHFRDQFRELLPVGFALLAALVAAFPLIRAVSDAGLILGTSSLWNADIAYYTISTRSLLESGLGAVPPSDWFITNLDLSKFTLEVNSGASVFLSLFSPVPELIGLMGNVAIVVVCALEWLGLYSIARVVLSRATAPVSAWPPYVAATGALLFGLNVQVIGQQFLAQLIGTTSAIAVVALVLDAWFDNRRAQTDVFALLAWSVIGVMAYATIWLPLLGALAVGLGILVTRSIIFRDWARIRYWILIAGAGALLLGPVIYCQWQILITHSTGSFGWPMTTSNDYFSVLVAFDPHLPPANWPREIQVFSWFCGLLGMVVAVRFARGLKEDARGVLLLSLISLIMLVVASAALFGWGDYRNWKAESYVLPLMLIIVFSCLLLGYRQLVRWVAAIGILAVSAISCAVYFSSSTVITSPDVLSLSRSDRLAEESGGVNIRLDGSFESMMVGAVLPTRGTIGSNSYFPPDVSTATCSLVLATDSLATLPGAVRLNDSYSLAPWPSDCMASKRSGSMTDLTSLASSVADMTPRAKSAVFYGGWNPVEVGGVWSTGRSILVLPTRVAEAQSWVTWRIHFETVPSENPQRTVKFSSAVDDVKTFLNANGTSQFIDLRVPVGSPAKVNVISSVQRIEGDWRNLGIFVTGIEAR